MDVSIVDVIVKGAKESGEFACGSGSGKEMTLICAVSVTSVGRDL